MHFREVTGYRVVNGLRLQGRRDTGPETAAICRQKASRDLRKLQREGGEERTA